MAVIKEMLKNFIVNELYLLALMVIPFGAIGLFLLAVGVINDFYVIAEMLWIIFIFVNVILLCCPVIVISFRLINSFHEWLSK